jgi:Cdc6-like AAA superfamily ATPase
MAHRFFNEKWSDQLKATIANMSDSEYREFMNTISSDPGTQQQKKPAYTSEEFKQILAERKKENQNKNSQKN